MIYKFILSISEINQLGKIYFDEFNQVIEIDTFDIFDKNFIRAPKENRYKNIKP